MESTKLVITGRPQVTFSFVLPHVREDEAERLFKEFCALVKARQGNIVTYNRLGSNTALMMIRKWLDGGGKKLPDGSNLDQWELVVIELPAMESEFIQHCSENELFLLPSLVTA